jgi:D-alanyl-lipoteichoic acid acyltransferase DltB (MBOAT superfamily)
LLLVTCYLLLVTCYLLLVTCYLLRVTCYLLLVNCFFLLFYKYLSFAHVVRLTIFFNSSIFFCCLLRPHAKLQTIAHTAPSGRIWVVLFFLLFLPRENKVISQVWPRMGVLQKMCQHHMGLIIPKSTSFALRCTSYHHG